jgi:nitrite reductase/ring-hydroxylating ferredoxin subunit
MPSTGTDPAYCLESANIVRVPAVASLAVGQAQLFNVDESTAVIVARDDAGFHALSGICTHACCVVSVCLTPACTTLTPTPAECTPTPVADIDPAASSVLCPCHASGFRLSDGEPTNPPAITALPSYALSFDGNDALVDTGTRVDAAQRVPAPA